MLVIVSRAQINRVLIDPLQQVRCNVCELGLGVAVGGSVIPINRAKVSLPVHQHITLGKILREAHQRIVD